MTEYSQKHDWTTRRASVDPQHDTDPPRLDDVCARLEKQGWEIVGTVVLDNRLSVVAKRRRNPFAEKS